MDLESLTNDELAEKLRSMGENIGPVIDSTRKVYLKKLDRLLRGEEWQSPSFATDEFSDQDEVDAQPAQPERIRETRYTEEVRHRTNLESYRSSSRSAYNQTLLDTSETRAPAHASRSAPNQSAVKADAKPQKSSGFSLCLRLILFVVVAVIIFLILMNMEPAGKGTIGEISG